MHEVIQTVIAAEAEAKRAVEAAKAEAVRTTSAARKRTESLIAEAREEALAQVEKIMMLARQEGEAEKKERLGKAASEIETNVRLDDIVQEHVIRGAIRSVCEGH